MSDENKEVEILDDEKDLVLDHDYDGIKELDHPLPFWWVMIFGITVAVSIPYYFYYTHADGPTLRMSLDEKMHHIEEKRAAWEAKQGGFNVEKFKAFYATDKGKKLGAKTYRRKCMACHGANLEGMIGPNLTDQYWLHGKGDLAGVYKVIKEGVVEKGMAAWGSVLSEEQMFGVIGHVMSFKNKNNPGKEPQGELIKE